MSENQKKQRITDLDAIELQILRSYVQYRKVMYELKINKQQVIIKVNQTDFWMTKWSIDIDTYLQNNALNRLDRAKERIRVLENIYK